MKAGSGGGGSAAINGDIVVNSEITAAAPAATVTGTTETVG